MTDWRVVFAVVLAYLAANLWVGLRAGKQSSDTVTGYVAGDRHFGTLVMYFVTGATMFSAFAFLGGPGWAYSQGGASFYILSYGVLGMAPYWIIGPRAARVGREYGYVTPASMLGHRFGHDAVAITAGILSVIAMVPYVALQMRGAGIVLEQVTDGRIAAWAGAALAYSVVMIYVWRSGVMGIGWTNVFQGVFMIVMAWALGLYLPTKLYGGIQPMFDAIRAARPEMLTAPGLDATGAPWTAGGFTSAVLVSALGLLMWPHLFMKAFAAKDNATIKRTIMLFPTFQLFLLPLFLVGFAGVMYATAPSSRDAIMPHLVLTSGLPALVVGLFCAGALAASMSTGDALIHGAASIAVEDVYRKSTGRTLDDLQQRTLIRIVAVVVALLGYVIALGTNVSLVDMLLAAYGIVVQLVPSTYGAFFWRRATAPGAIAGLIAGAAITGWMVLMPGLRPFDLHAGIVGLIVNLVAFIAVSLLTQPPASQHVEEWNNVSTGAKTG